MTDEILNWIVYLLLCGDGTLYCGITRDIKRRIAQHNGEIKGGAKYTAGRRPVRLLSSLNFCSGKEARRAEIKIKKLSKHEKLAFFGVNSNAII